MDRPHLIYGPLGVSFSPVEESSQFEREYQQLSESDSDAIGQWLRLQRAKGDFEDTDEVLLNLIVELHRKVDRLEKVIRNSEKELISLANRKHIESVGFHHFELREDFLKEGELYYGRIEMETYPERDIAIFFRAIDSRLAEIERIHNRDDRDWSSYVRARERIMIREKKGRDRWS
jgi:hypothetical protein